MSLTVRAAKGTPTGVRCQTAPSKGMMRLARGLTHRPGPDTFRGMMNPWDDPVYRAHVAVAASYVRTQAILRAMVRADLKVTFNEDEEALAFVKLEPSDNQISTAGTLLFVGLTYVTIESWLGVDTGVRLSDERVDAELEKVDVEALRQCRHAIFHPADVADPRQNAATNNAPGYLAAAVAINAAIKDYITTYFADVANAMRNGSPMPQRQVATAS